MCKSGTENDATSSANTISYVRGGGVRGGAVQEKHSAQVLENVRPRGVDGANHHGVSFHLVEQRNS